jgi:hypothetical protein
LNAQATGGIVNTGATVVGATGVTNALLATNVAAVSLTPTADNFEIGQPHYIFYNRLASS